MTLSKAGIKARAAQSGQKMGGQIMKTLQKKKPPAKVKKRPTPSDDVFSLQDAISLDVRKNIQSILDAESDLPDPLNAGQLGEMMGFASGNIYSIMKARNRIGTLTICRFSHALDCDPWLLVMPNDEFKKMVLPSYLRRRRGIGDGSDIKPRRSS